MNALESLEDSKRLIDEFLDIYSSILKESKKHSISSDLDEKSIIVLRVLYAKILSFRKLLDGIAYNYGDGKSEQEIVEPTTLFVIVRNVLELIYVYEYVFLMPDTQEKKEFAYYLYMCTGLKERLSFCEESDEDEDGQIRKTVEKMNAAKEKLIESSYYKNLTPHSQSLIQNRFTSKHPVYRFVFGANEVTPVNYEEACEGIGMDGRFFKYSYAYLSTHAHPTYLSLVQFREAYIGEEPLHDGFAGLATTFLISILSILIEDARSQVPYVEIVYQSLGTDVKELISHYIQLTRVKEF